MLIVVVVLTAAAAWTLGYICFWCFVQHSPVNMQFYFDWFNMVLTGSAGEAPSTVLLLSMFSVPILFIIELGLLWVWHKVRRRRELARGAILTPK